MSSIIKTIAITAAGLAVIAGLPAAAQTPGSDRRLAATENRDARQDARIDAGIASGQINAYEAARLDNQQGRIDNKQARLAADGNFSRRDYARVDHRQNQASRSIARARTNRR